MRTLRAGDVVEAFRVGAAVVVHDGLTGVVGIAQRLPGDAEHAGIDRFDFGVAAMRIHRDLQVGSQFAAQRAVDLLCFVAVAVVDFAGRLIQHVGDTGARVRPHAEKDCVDEAERIEAHDLGIHPAVQRNVGRSEAAGVAHRFGRHHPGKLDGRRCGLGVCILLWPSGGNRRDWTRRGALVLCTRERHILQAHEHKNGE